MKLNKIQENKKMIITITLSILFAGILGFYSGRYYEQQTFRSNIRNRMQNNTMRPNGEFRGQDEFRMRQ